jgi:glucose/arabinose dehydrogenase
LISGLYAPSNVALYGGYLYVGETNAISRYPYDPSAPVGPRDVVVPDLPTEGHATRTVVFGSDGFMYVSVGSSCNICQERDERRATILRYAPDGSGYERYAWGLRNAVGLAFQPATGLLWATVNERDNQGNETPPDLFTIVGEGQSFGWPNCQPPYAAPQNPGADCSGVTPPTTGLQAHGAPLGVTFYAGQQFPPDFVGDAFVVQHGSWNREPPAAPKLVRERFSGPAPISAQDFATGWQLPDSNRWGRPAGVTVAPDGSLIVSDDQAGVLYRITYSGG